MTNLLLDEIQNSMRTKQKFDNDKGYCFFCAL